MELSGMVFGIQFFSIHDGNGIRTNVFLSGCPLRCIWCHNPEGITGSASLSFTESKCTGCGACSKICPDVHSITHGIHTVNRDKCFCCFRCVRNCAGMALEQLGNEMTVSEVINSIVRDKRYYNTSGGGVTITGGEPMVQPLFTKAILEACKKKGVNTALETCGYTESELFEMILPFVDTFLYDIKESDPALHVKYTGVDNKLIMENLRLIAGHGKSIILRCPIIPGINDRADHFEQLALMSKLYPCIEGVEIMPYHKLGVSKNTRLGTLTQEQYETPSDDMVKNWINIITQAGGKVIKY